MTARAFWFLAFGALCLALSSCSEQYIKNPFYKNPHHPALEAFSEICIPARNSMFWLDYDYDKGETIRDLARRAEFDTDITFHPETDRKKPGQFKQAVFTSKGWKDGATSGRWASGIMTRYRCDVTGKDGPPLTKEAVEKNLMTPLGFKYLTSLTNFKPVQSGRVSITPDTPMYEVLTHTYCDPYLTHSQRVAYARLTVPVKLSPSRQPLLELIFDKCPYGTLNSERRRVSQLETGARAQAKMKTKALDHFKDRIDPALTENEDTPDEPKFDFEDETVPLKMQAFLQACVPLVLTADKGSSNWDRVAENNGFEKTDTPLIYSKSNEHGGEIELALEASENLPLLKSCTTSFDMKISTYDRMLGHVENEQKLWSIMAHTALDETVFAAMFDRQRPLQKACFKEAPFSIIQGLAAGPLPGETGRFKMLVQGPYAPLYRQLCGKAGK